MRFGLVELPEQVRLIDFLMNPCFSWQAREQDVSIRACALISKLYDLLRAQYSCSDSDEAAHALNVLSVRLVFFLHAEDAGFFDKGTFGQCPSSFTAPQLRNALRELFRVIDASDDARDQYISDFLRTFPYMNGALFTEEVESANFANEIRTVLLEAMPEGTNWSEISPTIFGGIFESTLNPEPAGLAGYIAKPREHSYSY
ncbi:type IIL restriction-modification enzyme MmeI [Neoactinobaculum massilliense]|uniref:type IIL restriction-modification enzyme MmeI n=1 Tax=Neoactinobaculum massilliense TaxID=2364794 RepID=UPI000F52ABB0|nr:type IIL restriction-modification enzyme MmeI [Neoactinobaculum massilliense]